MTNETSTDLTRLQRMADALATPEGIAAMSAELAANMATDRYARVHNGDGGRELKSGRRLDRAVIRMDGVEVAVEYATSGTYMRATETDPEEFPVCLVKRMEIGGWDVTRLLADREDEVASAVERQWGEE